MKKRNLILVILCVLMFGIKIDAIGVHNGKLMPCNGKWNCAITQTVDGQKPSTQPIYYTSSKKDARALLKKIILSFARVKIVSEADDYMHATFESGFWHFIDDVEFYLPNNAKVIQMRSASRKGKYDFGVNKRRLKKIKKMFDKDS